MLSYQFANFECFPLVIVHLVGWMKGSRRIHGKLTCPTQLCVVAHVDEASGPLNVYTISG